MTSPQFPGFFRVRQKFVSDALADVRSSTRQALDGASLSNRIEPGQTVAITAGSRGINHIATIIAETVRYVADCGGRPIIVPAMGSHGGATAEGQAALLASFGIDETTMRCPIESSMDTVLLGTTANGIDIHFDRVCSQADHVIVANRVKPHTRLAGSYESGILKMIMIGLGKHRGAQLYHQAFAEFGYCLDQLVQQIIPAILAQMPITLGLAIVEDAFEQTSRIIGLEPERLLDEEPRILDLARKSMPGLPFDRADLLIVDQMGKEISGTGMDTNVIGRKANDKHAGPEEWPKIREIYTRSLTNKSAGNACGIGIAEYCHRQLVDAMDKDITRINCVTSGHATAGAIPLTFDSDHDALEAVLSQASRTPRSDLKWMWIKDTLHLDEMWCSQAYWDKAQAKENLQILSEPLPLTFDAAGNLMSNNLSPN
ncbi:MAG: nickel-dependent lactate racemase [Pirellulales bacterium]|nr:nickel-dependent lactate racemase [Pirellulales bacterium]